MATAALPLQGLLDPARYPAPNDHGHDGADANKRIGSAGRRDPTSALNGASPPPLRRNDDRPIFLTRHVAGSPATGENLLAHR